MRKTEIYKLSEFSEVVLPFIVVYLFLTGRVRDRFNYETEFFIVTYFCENMVPVYFARLKFRALEQDDIDLDEESYDVQNENREKITM